MCYESVPQIDRKEYEQMIATQNPTRIANALLSISFWEDDGRWTENQLLAFIDHQDTEVRRIAALGFGHLARRYGSLDAARIEPALKKLATSQDSLLRGTAEDALDDIAIFIHQKPGRVREEAKG